MAKKKRYDDHVHKYERVKLGDWKKTGHEVYKCALPNCSHYVNDMALVVGRLSLCWGQLDDGKDCPHAVEMTRYMVFKEKRKHPLCGMCKEKRKELKEVAVNIEEARAAILQQLNIEESDDATINN